MGSARTGSNPVVVVFFLPPYGSATDLSISWLSSSTSASSARPTSFSSTACHSAALTSATGSSAIDSSTAASSSSASSAQHRPPGPEPRPHACALPVVSSPRKEALLQAQSPVGNLNIHSGPRLWLDTSAPFRTHPYRRNAPSCAYRAEHLYIPLRQTS